ncbi:MAG: oligopeptide transporter, OPT family [Candidatus Eisenbacteria bacterium]|nr:oligopeptide transporter, OPT family [Candidatus Eisenbacteria bacterium]
MSEKKRLGREAYGGCEGECYVPYVEHDRKIREFTLRAVIIGILVGIVFGAANAYIGLKVGITVGASIPAAVIAIAFSRFWRSTVLENNIVQTVGSAGESLAAGVIFTIPALIVLGFMPQLSKIFILSVVGGLLGVFFMIPLRRHLIVREHGRLPYPEGTACAEVLVAGDRGGEMVRRVMAGVGIGALYKFMMEGMELWSYRPEWDIRGIRGARIGGEITPALLGVGYVIGPRIAGIMLAGGAIGWLVLIPIIKMMGSGLVEPLYPATVPISEMGPADIWNYYIRYIGAGAVAFGGLVTLIKSVPTMVRSFRSGVREVARDKSPREAVARTSLDLPVKYVMAGALGLGVLAWLLPQIPVNLVGALLIVVFSFFFVTVSSSIVGLVGSTSNPASGMTIGTLLATSLIFLGLGWTGPTGMIGAISVGAVVCIAICIASDTSQDLKTGFLVGATPQKQQIGEIIGVLSSALVIGWVVFFLHRVYGIGSEQLPAPQAVLMSMVVRGVLEMSLPWTLVFIGVFIAACIELLGIPSLPFSVGLYLPIRLSTPIMVGGLVRLFTERTRDPEVLHGRREKGVLYGSGLIAGGGVMGILVAALYNAHLQRGLQTAAGEPVSRLTAAAASFYDFVNIGHGWAGGLAGAVALAAFALLTATLIWSVYAPRRSR